MLILAIMLLATGCTSVPTPMGAFKPLACRPQVDGVPWVFIPAAMNTLNGTVNNPSAFMDALNFYALRPRLTCPIGY